MVFFPEEDDPEQPSDPTLLLVFSPRYRRAWMDGKTRLWRTRESGGSLTMHQQREFDAILARIGKDDVLNGENGWIVKATVEGGEDAASWVLRWDHR